MSKKPQRSNDLLALWARVLEKEPGPNGLVLKVGFDSPKAAKYARIELYRIRTKARKQSMRNVDPDDPRYGTSIYDDYRIEQPGASRNGDGGINELHFFSTGFIGSGYTILDDDIASVATPVERKPRSKK